MIETEASPSSPVQLLEARQDAVIEQLDELDRRIELAIKQFTKGSLQIFREPEPGSAELN
jgi:hypothetical protein